MMTNVLNAFYYTMELWILLAILAVALGVEEFYKYMVARAERKQMEIDLEIDRLHR